MFRSHLNIFLLLSLLLYGCNSKPISIKYQEDFDFSQVESYGIYPRNSSFTEWQSISDATRNNVELAIEQVLDQRGFTYQDADNADIVIGYHFINSNTGELKQYNQGTGYCGFCLRGGETSFYNVDLGLRPGSLIIDIIHSGKKRSIWRGIYLLKITKKDNNQKIQQKIHQAVEVLLGSYPDNVSLNRIILNRLDNETIRINNGLARENI